MVYDVTKLETFEHIQDWLKEVNKYSPENTCKLLIGNKSDREDKQVTTEQASEYARTMCSDEKNAEQSASVPFWRRAPRQQITSMKLLQRWPPNS